MAAGRAPPAHLPLPPNKQTHAVVLAVIERSPKAKKGLGSIHADAVKSHLACFVSGWEVDMWW